MTDKGNNPTVSLNHTSAYHSTIDLKVVILLNIKNDANDWNILYLMIARHS